MARSVLVLPTGTANLASVLAAFAKLGANAGLADSVEALERAERVVLPGVGTFGAAIAGIREAGLDQVMLERVRAGRPTLAMCVGLQMLFEESDENPGIPGLGAVGAKISRFPADVRVPQFGWNEIDPGPGCRYLQPGYAYFANSYCALHAPGCEVARAWHGDSFVAALEIGDVVACQFHPELSGAFGHALIDRWLRGRP